VLERRGERYGSGVEAEAAVRQFKVRPPIVGVGSAGLGDLAPEPGEGAAGTPRIA
jgi:hypothetical protein